jgi:ABC-type branched-subunit amino acid transport system ATPase component
MRTFQISRELQKMTVKENLLLVPLHQKGERCWTSFLRPGSVKSQENGIVERAEELLDFLDLSPLKDEFAANLSTGQKKLLELGRAMMADPEVILLDEPGAGVNPTLMKKLLEHIRGLNDRGKTFLVIEHDMDLIMNLCDPVVVLNIGQKLMEGPPDEVRQDPRVLEAYLGEE